MWKYDLIKNTWHQIETSSDFKLIGRKLYSMSIYGDSIFLTGGVDANSTMLADFLRFDILTNRWVHLDISNNGINASKFLKGLAKMKPEMNILEHAANQLNKKQISKIVDVATANQAKEERMSRNAYLIRRHGHSMVTRFIDHKTKDGYQYLELKHYLFGG